MESTALFLVYVLVILTIFLALLYTGEGEQHLPGGPHANCEPYGLLG